MLLTPAQKAEIRRLYPEQIQGCDIVDSRVYRLREILTLAGYGSRPVTETDAILAAEQIWPAPPRYPAGWRVDPWPFPEEEADACR